MTLRGRATFAWQSDYGQFYLIDRHDSAFRPPTQFTADIEKRSLFVPAAGLVVYTNDCLQQHVRILVYDSEPELSPVECMSGNLWTRIETAVAVFPSRKFTISSPSMPDPLPGGPVFFLDAAAVTAHVSWMEFHGSRDDSVPVEPDVIEIAFWPH